MTTDKKSWRNWEPSVAAPFILAREGCELKAYKCPAGVWTIGAGHTGDDVHEGDEITQEQAIDLLAQDLQKFADALAPHVRAWCTRGQFVAMLSLAYNIGVTAFRRSTVLKMHNAGAIQQAADAFLMWKFAGGKPILLKRRQLERTEYLKC